MAEKDKIRSKDKNKFKPIQFLVVLIIGIISIIYAFYVLWQKYSFIASLVFIIVFVLLGLAWFFIPVYLDYLESKKIPKP